MLQNSSRYSQMLLVISCSLLMLTIHLSTKAQSATSTNWGKPNLLGFDTGWKFKAGRALPEYFKPEFNDSDWQSVTYKFLDTLTPYTKAFPNIGTFRRRFFVPDSMKGKQVELFLNQIGASEFYFDNILLRRFGSVGSKIKNEVHSQHSVPFILDSSSWHVLAIYHSQYIDSSIVKQYSLIGLGVTLVASENKNGDENYPYHHVIISLGIIAAFSLFFWFVYAFYPKRIASLIAALMLTSFSLIFIGVWIREYHNYDLNSFVRGERLWEVGFSNSYGWSLLFFYSVYYKKWNWRAFVVAALMMTSVIMIYTSSPFWFKTSVIFLVIYAIEACRILIMGIIKRKTGFWILAIGFFTTIVGMLTVIFNVFQLFSQYVTLTQTILGVAIDLCFPLTLALHLAWEFGTANRDLRRQLIHVNELSAKTLEQEQEKQQLLASQNETLEQQVLKRTAELNQSLETLKSAQGQLIQSEKMASLGELTAGIAHEIQNPLNFINNFSEVNNELLAEMKVEIDKGNIDEVKDIASDVIENERKINHHGKRADAIVKGMLQHSRASTGKKELTDINALCDEYLRLSYHGLRAKDKNFNADFKTDFDETIGQINIIPQDIGRVLLNLYNNAFYVVNEKKKQKGEAYEPTVTVSTKTVKPPSGDSRVSISVKDNGNGIPQKVIDKIFQPFFTTKPTGQGTGLGLSLSYDIIKAHGGEIKVETKEGEGSEFVIQLPVSGPPKSI